MSTVLEISKGRRKKLPKIGLALEGSQGTHTAWRLFHMSLERMACVQVAPGTPMPAPADGGLETEKEAAVSLAFARSGRVVSFVDATALVMRLSRTLHALTIPHRDLALFMGLLRYCGVLPKEQEYSLYEQEIVQKCAFIAQRAFGLDLEYEWHLNEYGTYSSFLASDHLELVEGGFQVDFGAFVGLDEVPGYQKLMESMPESIAVPREQFAAGRFISLVSGKDKGIEWLSVASAIVHEKGSCPDDELLDRVSRINADYGKKLGRRVMDDIVSSRPPAWGEPPRGGQA